MKAILFALTVAFGLACSTVVADDVAKNYPSNIYGLHPDTGTNYNHFDPLQGGRGSGGGILTIVNKSGWDCIVKLVSTSQSSKHPTVFLAGFIRRGETGIFTPIRALPAGFRVVFGFGAGWEEGWNFRTLQQAWAFERPLVFDPIRDVGRGEAWTISVPEPYGNVKATRVDNRVFDSIFVSR